MTMRRNKKGRSDRAAFLPMERTYYCELIKRTSSTVAGPCPITARIGDPSAPVPESIKACTLMVWTPTPTFRRTYWKVLPSKERSTDARSEVPIAQPSKKRTPLMTVHACRPGNGARLCVLRQKITCPECASTPSTNTRTLVLESSTGVAVAPSLNIPHCSEMAMKRSFFAGILMAVVASVNQVFGLLITFSCARSMADFAEGIPFELCEKSGRVARSSVETAAKRTNDLIPKTLPIQGLGN